MKWHKGHPRDAIPNMGDKDAIAFPTTIDGIDVEFSMTKFAMVRAVEIDHDDGITDVLNGIAEQVRDGNMLPFTESERPILTLNMGEAIQLATHCFVAWATAPTTVMIDEAIFLDCGKVEPEMGLGAVFTTYSLRVPFPRTYEDDTEQRAHAIAMAHRMAHGAKVVDLEKPDGYAGNN